MISVRILGIAWATFVAAAQAAVFELNSNKIYLPVTVNEKGPCWFILDTGSISNVIDTARAKSLSITSSGEFKANGAGEGYLEGSRAKNVSLRIDDAYLPKEEVDILPITRAIGFSEGRTIDGLLGCPFFQRFVTEIDYANHQVSFREAQSPPSGNASNAIPIEIERGNIFIQAGLVLPNGDQVIGRFVVDTGWRLALSLNTPFVKDHKLLGMTKTIEATAGVGIGGPVIDRVGRVNALHLGRFTIMDPVTTFATERGGVLAENGMAGIIGAEVLRRFTVILDYPNHRIILEPNTNFAEPYDFDMSGMYLSAEGDNLRTFRVYSLIANAPAAEAGLIKGDLIETIDGRSAAEFTLEQIRQRFRQPGKEYRLGVVRGKQKLTAKLITRKLI